MDLLIAWNIMYLVLFIFSDSLFIALFVVNMIQGVWGELNTAVKCVIIRIQNEIKIVTTVWNIVHIN